MKNIIYSVFLLFLLIGQAINPGRFPRGWRSQPMSYQGVQNAKGFSSNSRLFTQPIKTRSYATRSRYWELPKKQFYPNQGGRFLAPSLGIGWFGLSSNKDEEKRKELEQQKIEEKKRKIEEEYTIKMKKIQKEYKALYDVAWDRKLKLSPEDSWEEVVTPSYKSERELFKQECKNDRGNRGGSAIHVIFKRLMKKYDPEDVLDAFTNEKYYRSVYEYINIDQIWDALTDLLKSLTLSGDLPELKELLENYRPLDRELNPERLAVAVSKERTYFKSFIPEVIKNLQKEGKNKEKDLLVDQLIELIIPDQYMKYDLDTFEKIQDKLSLTPEQRQRIEQMWDQYRELQMKKESEIR